MFKDCSELNSLDFNKLYKYEKTTPISMSEIKAKKRIQKIIEDLNS